jgi:hypothetical protein
VALTGTVTSATEADIVTGGKTIILTLTNDTWVASAGSQFDNQRQNIIDGLTSAGAEVLGWNNEVRDKEVVASVVRTSDTVVTITLTASPLYDITADEAITATIPHTALQTTSGTDVEAAPTFTVTYVPEVVVTDTGAGSGGGRRKVVDVEEWLAQFDDAVDQIDAAPQKLQAIIKAPAPAPDQLTPHIEQLAHLRAKLEIQKEDNVLVAAAINRLESKLEAQTLEDLHVLLLLLVLLV